MYILKPVHHAESAMAVLLPNVPFAREKRAEKC